MYPQRVAIIVILVLSLGVLSSIAMVNPSLADEMTGKFGLSATSDLQFSTFIGTSDYDYVNDMTIDAEGNIYLVGTTWSTDFPTTAGSYRPWHSGGNSWEMEDAFVMKLSGDGQEIIYSTYLGGSSSDSGTDITVDDVGCVYVVGHTTSPDFPTVNAYDSTYNGVEDCFVAKLSANGSDLLFSTFIGGADEDHPYAIAVDDAGNSIIVGRTRSSDFPVITTNTLPGCLSRGGPQDGFVCKLSPDGSDVKYSMYLGGSGMVDEIRDVATADNGDIVLVGSSRSSTFPTVNAYDDTLNGSRDATITRLNATGHILFSTYYGGTAFEYTSAVAIDDEGLLYIAGIVVYNGTFPIVGVSDQVFNGTLGIFLVIMNSNGDEVMFSGVLANSRSEDFSTGCAGIALVSEREVWLAGSTHCSSFPTTEDAFDRTFNDEDGYFVMVDTVSGSLDYSSFFGGTSDDSISGLAVTSNGDIVCVGTTTSASLPTRNALISEQPGEEDGFVFKMTVDNSAYLLGLIVLGVAGVGVGAIIVIIAVVTLRSRPK